MIMELSIIAWGYLTLPKVFPLANITVRIGGWMIGSRSCMDRQEHSEPKRCLWYIIPELTDNDI